MSNNDRVSELYLGQIYSVGNQLICRRRINWMCSQATGRNVLDVGCSQGIASILLAREGFIVTGIDVEEAAIHFANKLLAEEPESVRDAVTFLRSDGAKMPFEDASFDSVLMGEVLEHLVHPEKVLAEITRVLKPGGRLVMTTPLGLHVYHDHKRSYYPTELTDLLEQFVTIETISFMDRYQWCNATNKKPAKSFWFRVAEVRELLAGFEFEMLRFEESAHVQQEEMKARAQKQGEMLAKEHAAHQQAHEDLARAITEHDKQVMTIRAETQVEHERWVGTAAELRERCKVLKKVEDVCANLRANLAESRERAATSEGRVQGLEVELARQLEERSHERTAAASAVAAAAAAAEHRFEAQALELEQARSALQTAQVAHAQRMAGLESSIQRALDVAVAERKDGEMRLASSYAAAKERISTLTSDLACTRKNGVKLERELTRNAELRGELRILRLSSSRLQAALNKARDDLAAARERAKMSEERARGLAPDVIRLMNELDLERKQAAEQRVALQESFEKRASILSDEVSRVSEAATTERTAAQTQKASAQARILALNDALAAARESAANEKAANEQALVTALAELRETVARFEAQERQMRETVVMHIDGELAALREMAQMQETCRSQDVHIRELEGRLARAESSRQSLSARLDAMHRSKLGALTLKYWGWRARLRRYAARRKDKAT